MRFIEWRKTGLFRKRQRFYRLAAPAVLLLIAIVYDTRFWLAWDPCYQEGSPTAPVWTAARFLFLNALLLRVLAWLWLETRWVFPGPFLRRLPLFALQAVLFSLPFVPPFLALKNYTTHETRGFQRLFPACAFSRVVDQAPPSRRFQDTRYLYVLYERPDAASPAGAEIRLLRFLRGAQDKVRAAREPLLAQLAAGDTLDRAAIEERERAALAGLLDDLPVARLPKTTITRLEFRIAPGVLAAAFETSAAPGALNLSLSRDHGRSWSAPAEVSSQDPILRHTRVPVSRSILIRSTDAFAGGVEGVSLASLRPSQIVEDDRYLYAIRFRDKTLCLARYDKQTETWLRPLAGGKEMIDALAVEIAGMLGNAAPSARTSAPLLPGLAAPAAPASDSAAAFDAAAQRLAQDAARERALSQRLAKIEEAYGADRTKLEIVETKLYAIEDRLDQILRPAPTPAAPAEAPDPLGLNATLALMNRCRDHVSQTRDESDAASFECDEIAAALDEAEKALDLNRKALAAQRRALEEAIRHAVDASPGAQPPSDLVRLQRQSEALYRASSAYYQQWATIEEARREILIRTRGPLSLRLQKARRRIADAERRLSLGRRDAEEVRSRLKTLRERLDLPLLPLPADHALPAHGATLYIASQIPAAGARPLLVRYHAPDTSKGAPAARAQTAWLISKDLGETWNPCPAQDTPPAAFLSGRSFLFGSTAAGADLLDRIIAGSHFYFTPRVLSASLLACFALCAVLAFISAALCDTRNPWQYLLLRKLSEVFVNGIAAVPAVILLIVVGAGASASRAVPAEWAVIAAIVFTQIPNVYQYLYAAIAEYRSSERLAHDLSIGLSWPRILINKILLERSLRIFVIQAFYILGYIILFETTLSYLGFAPSGDLDSWGKLLVEEGRLPMARWLQTGVPGLNDWVFLAPLACILLSIYAANRIGQLLARCLLPRRAVAE